MLTLYRILFCASIFLLSACGGGSDSTSSETGQTITTSTINGSINTAANMQFDSDLNDINTPFIDNSRFSLAQNLPNFATLQGFVSKIPTRDFTLPNGEVNEERRSDRFFNKTDEDDYFKVQLQKGQKIQLQVVNFEPRENSVEAFSGDIDLFLYDQTNALVASSISTDEFESVQAQNSGLHYIQVNAWREASRYILNILPASTENNLTTLAISENATDFVPNQLIVQYKREALFKSSNAFIKTLHAGVSRPTLAFLDEAKAINFNANSRSSLNELASLNPESYQKLLTLKKLKTLKQQSNVASASLNYIRKRHKTPSDTFYDLQWHYQAMKLPQAWDITTGTPNTGSIIVAVIDTGIYSQHPELANQLVDGFDFIKDNDNSGDDEPGIDNNPEDPGDGQGQGNSSWHGTHVAGTIAAESDNEIGVAGVAWGAKIMPLRALGKTGGTSYDIMQAVLFAAGLENDSGTLPTQRADIINLSLGGAGSSMMERDLYQQVYDMGIMIVASAGNDNSSAAAYPASYPGVISVSATDFNQRKAPYSNFGQFIDIAAPGGNLSANLNGGNYPDGILSTLVDDSSGQAAPTLDFYQGTSMAAPHVSGMLALMKAVYPDLSPRIVDDLLANGALTDDAGATGRDNTYGYGNANALKAVKAAQALFNGGELPPPPPILLVSPSSVSFSESNPQAIVILSNEGAGEPELLSTTSNNDWLSVVPINVDSNGIGSYELSVNTTNLSEGFYLGSAVFRFNNASSIVVRASLNIGDISSNGKLANLFTLLYDIDQGVVIDSAQGINNNTETVQFRFTQVPPGRYEIISGTDVDNDGFICQLGEACAIYPSSSQIDPIDNTNLETINVEMTAIILNNLNSPNQNNLKPVNVAIKRPSETSRPVPVIRQVNETKKIKK